MKVLVLCICVLGFAPFNLADSEVKLQIKNAVSNIEENIMICMTENNLSYDDVYKEKEIMTGVHTQPENEARTRKMGCTVACILKKENLMVGSNIQERKVHAKINRECGGCSEVGQVHKIMRNCMKEVRSITEECEKGISLYTCVMRAIHKLEEHGEHENPETEESEETEENEETETI